MHSAERRQIPGVIINGRLMTGAANYSGFKSINKIAIPAQRKKRFIDGSNYISRVGSYLVIYYVSSPLDFIKRHFPIIYITSDYKEVDSSEWSELGNQAKCECDSTDLKKLNALIRYARIHRL